MSPLLESFMQQSVLKSAYQSGSRKYSGSSVFLLRHEIRIKITPDYSRKKTVSLKL